MFSALRAAGRLSVTVATPSTTSSRTVSFTSPSADRLEVTDVLQRPGPLGRSFQTAWTCMPTVELVSRVRDVDAAAHVWISRVAEPSRTISA